ncbi:MAG: hypothetical protein J6T27_01165 [Alphaproteobacteria bacterium]|nr:hypothetical protein [Alphaproteobacteria bacterium]
MRFDNFATKEEKKKLPEITGPQTKTYTKDDFLSATKLVNELGLPKDVIEKAMRDMRFNRTTIVFNNRKSPVIIGSDKKNLRVHPMGLALFKEYVLKQNGGKK